MTDRPVTHRGDEGSKSASDLRQLAESLACRRVASLDDYQVDPDFIRAFSIAYCRDHGVLGTTRASGDQTDYLYVAVADWEGWRQCDAIGRIMRRPVEPIVAPADVIVSATNRAFEASDISVELAVQDSLKGDLDSMVAAAQREDLLDSEHQAPIIRLVNKLLHDAVTAEASDIHIQPAENHVLVRQRVDGVLFESAQLPKTIQEEVLSRVKVLGGMNIAEKRLPQDGRATVELGDRVVDLRIASLPTSHNERIVIRLLDKSARLYTLGELGMSAATLLTWRKLIRLTHGLILVTGPTGSGKSTTLYSALQEINSTQLNVLTVEDPIEYQLDGISQTQINVTKGLTFASGMRSVLRQDPDIIMVGEIRDAETAAMAMQASMTGHLVFSTLHTSDAAGAISRLLDLNVEPYLISTSLVAVLAQRLVRRLCRQCRRSVEIRREEINERQRWQNTYEPVGCDACRHTGYRGRIGVYELLVMDENCSGLVQRRASTADLREAARAGGMSLLLDDGMQRVSAGDTTVEEVLRITASDFENISD